MGSRAALGLSASRRRGPVAARLAAICLLALGACTGPEPERVEHLALAERIDRARAGPAGAAVEGGSQPGEVPSGGTVFLPAGTSTSLALFMPEAAELRLDAVVARGGAALELTIETDAGRFATEALGSSQGMLSVDLPAAQPARLVFAVTGAAGGAGRAGVVLRAPAIWGAPGRPEPSRLEPPAPSARPPVVIYLIDTLRRDRLGCYGYEKPITPQIDAFAARATLYEDAVGQSSWTKASVASTFTGVWPPAHGAISWHQAVPERFDTLAELLERAGYATAAYSANPNIVPHFGFDQGFQSFTKHPKLLSAELNALAFEWLADIPEGQTFFLYMQPVDPHAGYNPPKEFLDRHAPGVDPWGWRGKAKWKWPLKALPTLLLLYDAEIAANDDSFGALLDELERRGLYDSALIVLTSDHGEEFREHGGWRHGSHLYRETLDVPLVIKYPGQVEGRRVTGAAQHIDILPTVLEVAGIPVPDGLEGMSLVGAAASLPERRAYSHLRLGSKPAHLALIEGDWKLIQRLRGDQTDAFLYNLADDPGEQEDVAGSFPVRAAAMTALLEERLAQATVEAETVELDAELERDLRALGYLQ